MKDKFTTKDFITIGALNALFLVVIMIFGAITSFNPVIHIFSTAMSAIPGGIVFLTLITKVPKRGIFLITGIILNLIFQALGMGYLPVIIGMMSGCLIGEIICSLSSYKNFASIMFGYAGMMVGYASSNLLPVLYAKDQFIKEMMKMGMTLEYMTKMTDFINIPASVLVFSLTILGSVVGMLIGKKVSKKHLEKAGVM